jgi:hypothetical protein
MGVSNSSKIRGDICSSRCTNGVVDTGGKWKKSSIIIVWTPLGRELTYRYIFTFKFTLRSLKPDIVLTTPAANCPWCRFFDTGGNTPPVTLTPVTNLPTVSITLAKRVAKFATGVVDTGGAP